MCSYLQEVDSTIPYFHQNLDKWYFETEWLIGDIIRDLRETSQ